MRKGLRASTGVADMNSVGNTGNSEPYGTMLGNIAAVRDWYKETYLTYSVASLGLRIENLRQEVENQMPVGQSAEMVVGINTSNVDITSVGIYSESQPLIFSSDTKVLRIPVTGKNASQADGIIPSGITHTSGVSFASSVSFVNSERTERTVSDGKGHELHQKTESSLGYREREFYNGHEIA